MPSRVGILSAFLAACVLLPSPAGEASPASGPGVPPGREDRPSTPAEALPGLLPWESNAGQAPRSVLAVGRGGGATVLVERRGARFLVPGGCVAMRFEGAGGGTPRFGRRLRGVSHYLVGSDPALWRRGVPHHAGLVVPGAGGSAAVEWTSRGTLLAYDLRLPAGADPAALEIRFEGGGPLSLGGDGALRVPVAGGVLRHGAPRAFQVAGGRRFEVPARFVLLGAGRAGFEVPGRDASLPLVIDPDVDFASYLGGTSAEGASAVAAAPGGAVLLAGTTPSADFPVVDPIQGTKGAAGDAYVTRIDPDSREIVWSTFLGGSNSDEVRAMAVDGATVLLAGSTSSPDFPTANALDGTLNATGTVGSEDGFAARLALDGQSLTWSTYIGGNGRDWAGGIGTAPDGSVLVGGASWNFPPPAAGGDSTDFTGTAGASAGPVTYGGTWALSLAPDGSARRWMFLLGPAANLGIQMAVAPDGDAVLAGTGAFGASFPATPGVFGPTGYPMSGLPDVFVARVKSDGSGLRWAGLLAGSGVESAGGLATGADGSVFVLGITGSDNFPKAGALQPARAGLNDAFVSKIVPDGSSLAWSTYLGGTGNEAVGTNGIAVVADGSACVTGFTSGSFPNVRAPSNLSGTNGDAFFARIASDGSQLLNSFRFGGTGLDFGISVAMDGRRAIVAGSSTAPSTLPGAGPPQAAHAGGIGADAFVLRFDVRPRPVLELRASLAGETLGRLDWILQGTDADSFRVERHVDSGPWEVLSTPPAGAVFEFDPGVEPDHVYTYRVFAVGGPDESVPSNEAYLQTVPSAPAGLVATVISSRRIDLSWTDLSFGERSFQVQRDDEDGTSSIVWQTEPDAEAWSDSTVLPDRSYTYRVRAWNPWAASAWSNDASGRTPATLDLRVERGTIVLSRRAERDRARMRGSFDPLPDGPGVVIDPRIDGLRLQAGGWGGAALADVPALSPEWRTKGAVLLWRSPPGDRPRVRLRVDLAAGTFDLRTSRAELVPEPGVPLVVTLGTGAYQGSGEDDWRRRGRRLLLRPHGSDD